MTIRGVGPMLMIGFLCPAAFAGGTVIQRVNLVDLAAGETRADHSVQIEAGRIAWVGPSVELKDLAGGTEVIDANGA